MKDTQKSNYPPKGWLRFAYRFPVYFYRLGLGWLMGGRFVLINHIGRKSGKPYQAVVEIVERDEETGSIAVVAGYGPQTQWYQNLRAHPQTVIQVGNRKISVASQFITPEDGAEIMVSYLDRYGRITGWLFSTLGYDWDGTEAGARQIAIDALRFVRFMPEPEQG